MTMPKLAVEASYHQICTPWKTSIQEVISGLHSDPYLRCFRPEEAKSTIQGIHDGDYENQMRDRSLTHKAINQGYYWSKMFDEAKEYVKKCPQCQRFFKQTQHGPPNSEESLSLHTVGT